MNTLDRIVSMLKRNPDLVEPLARALDLATSAPIALLLARVGSDGCFP